MERSSASSREPWDIKRFAETVLTFNPPPNPLELLSKFLADDLEAPLIHPEDVIWSNDKALIGIFRWASLDDVVMGGVSKSTFTVQSGGGVFSGVISEANSGGFAGVRTLPFENPLDMSLCHGIVLKFRGNGQRFKLVMRDDSSWNGIAWTTTFDTIANIDMELCIPFANLIPTQYAKVLSSADLDQRTGWTGNSFDSSQVHAFQIVLSKYEYDNELNPLFEPGPFEFVIKEIGAC